MKINQRISFDEREIVCSEIIGGKQVEQNYYTAKTNHLNCLTTGFFLFKLYTFRKCMCGGTRYMRQWSNIMRNE